MYAKATNSPLESSQSDEEITETAFNTDHDNNIPLSHLNSLVDGGLRTDTMTFLIFCDVDTLLEHLAHMVQLPKHACATSHSMTLLPTNREKSSTDNSYTEERCHEPFLILVPISLDPQKNFVLPTRASSPCQPYFLRNAPSDQALSWFQIVGHLLHSAV